MQLSTLSLLCLGLLTSWFGLDFVGLPNVVEREPVISLAGVMLGLLAAFALAGVFMVRYVAPIYATALMVWTGLQVETHWSTYLLIDASARKLAWYNDEFGAHWRVLPEIAGRTTPDGYHTVLAVLIVLSFLVAVRDSLQPAQPPNGLFKNPSF